MQALARELFSLKAAHTLEELNRRYRSLCKQYHPDLQQQAQREDFERHMQSINAAYNESLRRFNIFTQRQPAARPSPSSPPAAAQAWPQGGRVSVSVTPRQVPSAGAAPAAKAGPAAFSPEAVRLLASALATLKKTRSFFSLKATDDPKEKDLFIQGLEELQKVIERHGGREGREALYYQAVALCNLREYKLAFKLFNQYAEHYPAHQRDGAFHFYRGLLAHRLGLFEEAGREYLLFLLGHNGGQYKHFAALVAGFKDAAAQGLIPPSLPYG